MGRPIEEGMLFELAKNLLAQVVVDGRAWPCAMISLSVGGFEDGVTGNKGIGGFLLHGDAAKAMKAASSATLANLDLSTTSTAQPNKRRKVEDTRINNFFLRQEESTGGGDDELEPTDFDDLPSAQPEKPTHSTNTKTTSPTFTSDIPSTTLANTQADISTDLKSFDMPSSSAQPPTASSSPPTAATPTYPALTSASPNTSTTSTTSTTTFTCPRCSKTLLADQRAEHDDWHFAQELMELDQAEQRTQLQQQQQRQQQQQAKAKPTGKSATTPGPQKPRPPASASGRGRGRPPGGGASGGNGGGGGGSEGGELEKGQKRLAFGR